MLNGNSETITSRLTDFSGVDSRPETIGPRLQGSRRDTNPRPIFDEQCIYSWTIANHLTQHLTYIGCKKNELTIRQSHTIHTAQLWRHSDIFISKYTQYKFLKISQTKTDKWVFKSTRKQKHRLKGNAIPAGYSHTNAHYAGGVSYNLNSKYEVFCTTISCISQNFQRKFAILVAPPDDATTKPLVRCKAHPVL